MHNNAVVRFIEYISNSRADIGEQANGVSYEISGTEYAVELSEDILTVVIYDASL